MSGTKKVVVDQSAWARAQRDAARLREINRTLPAMLEALREDQQAAIDRAAAQLSTRQDALDNALTGLSERARTFESRTSRRIREQASRLRATAAELRNDAQVTAEEQERRFQQALHREREDRLRDFTALRGELAGLRADRARALTAARTLLADARLLSAAIATELPHERFAPGRLSEFDGKLDLAERDVADGHAEAALALGQDTFLELGALRAEVAMRDQEWQTARLTARAAVTLLQEQIRLNTNPDLPEFPGAALDVDYWSRGRLSALKDKTNALVARVDDTADPPSLAELLEVAERRVSSLDDELTGILTDAHRALFGSQARVNVAEQVVAALEASTGYAWEPGQAIYEHGDQREAFYSKLRHPDGSELIIEVSPDEASDSCVLRLLSYDVGIPDEEARSERAHSVADSLRAQGLRVADPVNESAEPDTRKTDFDTLSQPIQQRARV